MAKIIEDGKAFKEHLENEIISSHIANNATYISINYVESPKYRRTDRLGINYAVEELNKAPNRSIFLYSFEGAQELYLINNFMKLMAKPNVHFLRLPFDSKMLDLEINMPKFYSEAMDVASRVKEKTDLRGILLHTYSNRPQEVIEEAKKAFNLSGSDDEIISQLRKYNSQEVEPKGILPGIFVDVEGTLVKHGQINKEVANMIRTYSQNKPVHIWTGGDKEKTTYCIASHLRNEFSKTMDEVILSRIPILSKQAFRGFEPEIIIDDISTDEFKDTYKMTPKEHIRIK